MKNYDKSVNLDDFTILSIGIPTRNRVAYLRECLNSIWKQSHGGIEVIISDNASDDATSVYLDELESSVHMLPVRSLKIIRQSKNIGMVPNWNVCLRAMSAPVGVILSDDDVLRPGFIEKMPPLISAQSPLAFCDCRLVDGDGLVLKNGVISSDWPIEMKSDEFMKSCLHERLSVFPSAIVFDVQLAKRHEFQNYHNVTDVEFRVWLAAQGGVVRWLPESLVDYRVHWGGLTHSGQVSNSTSEAMRQLRINFGYPLWFDHLGPAWTSFRLLLKRLPGLRPLVRILRGGIRP